MAKKPKTLKEIAIELLEKYEASETTVICEYSTNIRHSEEVLKKEVAKYRKMIDKADRKTEPSNSEIPNNCDTCRNKGFEGCEQPCLGCGCCGLYEPKDEPQTDCDHKCIQTEIGCEKTDCAWK